MASPLFMDGGPANMQALIDALQGRRRYPIDDPVSGYQPATDPDAKPPPYAPPQFIAAPRPRRTPQDMIDEAARAKAAFQPVTPNIPERIGDIAAKTGQVGKAIATAPVNAVRNLYEKVAADQQPPSLSSDEYRDPRAMAQDPDVPATALGLMGAGVPFAKPGTMGITGGRLVVPPAARAAGETGPFYSAVEQALTNSKLEKAPIDQWHNYLKGQPNVKAEELHHLGIVPGDVTKSGSLTKAQLQEHLDANRVQLKEVTKGGKFDDRGPVSFPDSGYNPAKYESYQLPGASNYGETLLTLPKDTSFNKFMNEMGQKYNIDPSNMTNAGKLYRDMLTKEERQKWDSLGLQTPESDVSYRSSHWDEPNVLVHVRHNDRQVPSPSGEGTVPSLHLEEVQSDWHQAGRKQGYKSEARIPDEMQKLSDAVGGGRRTDPNTISERDFDNAVKNGLISQEDRNRLTNWRTSANLNGVPDAPFKDTWPDLALKRMLHKAANERNPDGSFRYHSLSWTPGEAQAARYDLSKQLDKVQYSPSDAGGRIVGIKNGQVIVNKAGVPPEQLADHIGKDAAEKLLATDPDARPHMGKVRSNETPPWDNVQLNGVHELEGENLKLPHKGMQDFYDKMLVDKANALGKRYGARVGQAETKGEPGSPQFTVIDQNGNARGNFATREEAKRWLINPPDFVDSVRSYVKQVENKDVIPSAKLHVLPITPELRAAVAKGFPLFALGATAGPALMSQREPVPLSDAAAKALATKPPDVGLGR